jgi:hypothetical protein
MQQQWRQSGKRKEVDETQFTTKKWFISEFRIPLKANVLFLAVLFSNVLTFQTSNYKSSQPDFRGEVMFKNLKMKQQWL